MCSTVYACSFICGHSRRLRKVSCKTAGLRRVIRGRAQCKEANVLQLTPDFCSECRDFYKAQVTLIRYNDKSTILRYWAYKSHLWLTEPLSARQITTQFVNSEWIKYREMPNYALLAEERLVWHTILRIRPGVVSLEAPFGTSGVEVYHLGAVFEVIRRARNYILEQASDRLPEDPDAWFQHKRHADERIDWSQIPDAKDLCVTDFELIGLTLFENSRIGHKLDARHVHLEPPSDVEKVPWFPTGNPSTAPGGVSRSPTRAELCDRLNHRIERAQARHDRKRSGDGACSSCDVASEASYTLQGRRRQGSFSTSTSFEPISHQQPAQLGRSCLLACDDKYQLLHGSTEPKFLPLEAPDGMNCFYFDGYDFRHISPPNGKITRPSQPLTSVWLWTDSHWKQLRPTVEPPAMNNSCMIYHQMGIPWVTFDGLKFWYCREVDPWGPSQAEEVLGVVREEIAPTAPLNQGVDGGQDKPVSVSSLSSDCTEHSLALTESNLKLLNTRTEMKQVQHRAAVKPHDVPTGTNTAASQHLRTPARTASVRPKGIVVPDAGQRTPRRVRFRLEDASDRDSISVPSELPPLSELEHFTLDYMGLPEVDPVDELAIARLGKRPAVDPEGEIEQPELQRETRHQAESLAMGFFDGDDDTKTRSSITSAVPPGEELVSGEVASYRAGLARAVMLSEPQRANICHI